LSSQVITLESGLAGTRQTVAYMIRLAAGESATAAVREAAERIVRGLPEKDWAAEARAVAEWVRTHMRYTRDGLETETLKTPTRMLREIASRGRACLDCDDAAVLIASILLSIGHAPAFEVLGRGRVPHHVRVLDKSTNLVLDPTVGEISGSGGFGFREVYDVRGPYTAGVAGLGAEVAPEKSPLERWLPIFIGGRLLVGLFRRK
jgi:hypothetical protein